MDISILQKEPDLNTCIEIRIRPLAPLSMVTDFPGSYYKTLLYPTKKMLSGLFENILGWHFDIKTRKDIVKDIRKLRKKQKLDTRIDKFINGSTFQPLLIEYFEIDEKPMIDDIRSICSYDDYWSKSYRRSDSYKHINGSRFMDASTIPLYRELIENVNNNDSITSTEKNKLKDDWFKNNIGAFPMYYSTPTKREYIHIDGVMVYKLNMDNELADLLIDNANNIGYLGTNEGWVDLKINRL